MPTVSACGGRSATEVLQDRQERLHDREGEDGQRDSKGKVTGKASVQEELLQRSRQRRTVAAQVSPCSQAILLVKKDTGFEVVLLLSGGFCSHGRREEGKTRVEVTGKTRQKEKYS